MKSPVISSQDYFPFGLTFNSYQRENAINDQYQYSGKEKQDELSLGWLDYGARMYMPDIGRWGVIDSQSNLMVHLSPYRYAYNNPLRFNDRNGETEEERIKAVNWVLAWMNAHYNEKWAERTNDCAFLVASAIMGAGLNDLRTGAGFRGATNAVSMMAGNMREIGTNEARLGDALTFKTNRQEHKGVDGEFDHIGIVTKVLTDEKGNTIGYEVVQYQSGGPRQQTVMLDKKHAFLTLKSAWQWDTPEEAEDNHVYTGPPMEPIVINGQRIDNDQKTTLRNLEILELTMPKKSSDFMYSPELKEWWRPSEEDN